MLTAQQLYERTLRSAPPRRVAVVDGARQLTYADLEQRSARLANALLALGAGPDRPAAALLGNRAEFVEFDVACSRAGVTRVGISDRLSGEECRFILEHARAAVLVTSPELLERIPDLPDELAAVFLLDTERVPSKDRVAFYAYELALAAAAPHLHIRAVEPEAPNYILYTSGTTGVPKGATHSHAGRVASMVNMLASELRFGERCSFVHAAPLTHGSGSKLIAVLAAAGTNIVLRKFDPDSFANAVETQRGTHTFLVPTMLRRLLDGGSHVVSATASMQQISFGGSPIAAAEFARAIDKLGPILTQVYGSCEAPHPVTLLGPRDYGDGSDERVLTSAGSASFGVELRVVDDRGDELPAGDVGELLVRGYNLMQGYWRDHEATEAAFVDGWYRTGDLAAVDSDGLVTFRDRKRDLIISGGLNIYPSEVERVLAEHPGVREVTVVGYPDDEWGESVLAYVVAADGWDASADELIEWTRGRLASYKKPRRVEFLERLPLGPSNKVLRKELRDVLWQGRERRVN